MSDGVALDLTAEDVSLSQVLADSEKNVKLFANELKAILEDIGAGQRPVEFLTSSIVGNTSATGSWLEKLASGANILTGAKAGLDLMSGAFSKAKDTAMSFVNAASSAEDGDKRLQVQLRATGEAAGWSFDQLNDLAGQLQKVTAYEDDVTKSAAAMLTRFKNVRGDIFVDAIKSAQDLAAATGGDLNSAIFKLGRALDDPIDALNALRREGIHFEDAQKDMINTLVAEGKVMEAQQIVLDAVRERFGGMAQEMGGTWSGMIARATNRLGDMQESIGNALIPVLKELWPVFDEGATFIENMLPGIAEVIQVGIDWGKDWIASLKPMFEYVLDMGFKVIFWVQDGIDYFLQFTETIKDISSAGVEWAGSWAHTLFPVLSFLGSSTEEIFKTLEIVFENFWDLLELTGVLLTYSLVKTYNEIAYYLTEVLPEILKWFADNWFSIWLDLQSAQFKILENMGKNIWDFISYVKDLLTGKKGEFKFTGLLEGFEATTKELPQIMSRVEGEMEKALREDVETLTDKIGTKIATNEMDNRVKDAKDKIKEMFKSGAKELDLKHGEISDKYDLDTKPEKKEKEKKDKEKKDKEKGDANLEDLVGLNKRITEAAASVKKDDKVKDAIEDAADKEVEAINDLKEEIKNAAAEQIDAVVESTKKQMEAIGAVVDLQDSKKDVQNDLFMSMDNLVTEALTGTIADASVMVKSTIDEAAAMVDAVNLQLDDISDKSDPLLEALENMDASQAVRDEAMLKMMSSLEDVMGSTSVSTKKMADDGITARYGK